MEAWRVGATYPKHFPSGDLGWIWSYFTPVNGRKSMGNWGEITPISGVITLGMKITVDALRIQTPPRIEGSNPIRKEQDLRCNPGKDSTWHLYIYIYVYMFQVPDPSLED